MKTAATEATALAALDFPVFLTAYDPSDLPGSSLDPLGFERGYLFLADKILPGLTNVADRPRYLSVLCAGAFLAEVDVSDPPRLQYQQRLDCILRFERFWTLANVLAARECSDGAFPVSGIRGVTYASAKVESLLRSRSRRTDADFQLLSRQVPYGVVGVYGAVAGGMRFIDRKTLTLTPDLGERLGEGFLQQTETPNVLIKAVKNRSDIAVGKLTEWGLRSHLAGEAIPVEHKCFAEALHRDAVRSRMTEVLSHYPFRGDGDTELSRFQRLLPALAAHEENKDLHEAVAATLAYEDAYRLAMLGFERLLWLCRILPAAAIESFDIDSDQVLSHVCAALPAASQRFSSALASAVTEQFRQDSHRLEDTRRFLERAAAACGSRSALTRELVDRHFDVQQGKFDKGRRKMPWLEVTADRISLTMTRVGGLDREATLPTSIAPHPYRLSSADALIAAARGA